ncbi:MAG: hypothetical protein AB7K24_20825 [Gemmataceae bacterium]
MSYLRTFIPAVALIGILAWALAVGQQPAKDPPKVSPTPLVDPGAQKTLDSAIAALDRKKLPWIETTVWQRMQVDGLSFQAQGVYLAGPEHQLHLLLKVQSGDAAGRLEVVCDGKTYWETMQIGSGMRSVTKFDFQRVMAVVNDPTLPAPSRTNLMQRRFFAGVVPLLESIQKNMVFSKLDTTSWEGNSVQRISGTWKPEIAKAILAQDPRKRWPDNIPRECRIVFDSKTYWPYRLEWWGPQGRDPHTLLFEMEFRSPRFEAMAADRAAQVFHFQPDDKLKIEDRTQLIIDNLRQGQR